MPLPVQRFDVIGSADQLGMQDRVAFAIKKAVANAIGGGAGASVATVVTFSEPLPTNYAVLVTPNQDATFWISARSTAGFTVNLAPRLAANTLAAGSFDVAVFG
ncbi:hypothetical protein GCM10007036_14240 [Alsobacter metallidurans]|uniref:Uncharacterized protein n=1 Tax=Alsobacter metallidurans TaxID=340221 RepID=A0A917I6K4_9HYPH|nr:hypothetical protein [Alsobacter metallidurans]GGH14734.1 hypothetical protein GCM10007036_14240 [Alsobacter metallidurans]